MHQDMCTLKFLRNVLSFGFLSSIYQINTPEKKAKELYLGCPLSMIVLGLKGVRGC